MNPWVYVPMCSVGQFSDALCKCHPHHDVSVTGNVMLGEIKWSDKTLAHYYMTICIYMYNVHRAHNYIIHESSVGLSSTTNPSLGVAIPVPAQTHLYTHAKGRAT